MAVITLTSDLGYNDYSIPATKGYLLKEIGELQLVDISHSVKPFHYSEAAFILGHAMEDFPAGTVHLVAVEGDFERPACYTAAGIAGQVVMSKNTGLISLLGDSEPEWQVALDLESKKDLKFPLRNILARSAVKWLKNKDHSKLGKSLEHPNVKQELQPVLSKNSMTGTIIHHNHHQNVVTNIHRRLFERFSEMNACKIHYNRTSFFSKIHNALQDVPEGEAACYFGANGLLEIGINGGFAAELLSLPVGKNIWIEFN